MKKEDNYFHTYANIDLNALEYNLKQIKRIIDPKVKIMATVKANAYGHGIVEVSKFLADKVDYLGVAYVEEGVQIRKSGIKTPILILGNTLDEGLEKALKYKLEVTVTDEKTAVKINQIAAKMKKKAALQIKIDTGMGRLGFWHKDAFEAIKKINGLEHIVIKGLYTHLSSVDKDHDFTLMQLDRFNQIIESVEAAKIKIGIYHAANSLATLHYKQAHFNLVRPGIILYGAYPDIASKEIIGVKPILSLKTKVIYIKNVEAGRSISYGRTYIAKKDMKIATLPVGYADGYTHLLTHKAKVLIKGKEVAVIGKICMDQIMIDVSSIADLALGDEVTLIGKDSNREITVEELAQLAGTIPYELLCWIGDRVKRIYIRK
jgi:alanine racemase